MRRNRFSDRGSLTVEACVAFPVFLCFFLLLMFFIKFACVSLTLDMAVNETAKQIASSAYPIAFLNELEDDVIAGYGSKSIPTVKEELDKLPEYAGIGTADNLYTQVLTGKLPQQDIGGMLKTVGMDYADGIAAYFTREAAGTYWQYKSDAKYSIAKALLDGYLHNGLIDENRIKFRLVEFPQGEAEYKARSGQYNAYGFNVNNQSDTGTDDVDITKDDVIIQVEYKFDIPLPIFGSKSIKMVHTAVERAWLKGSYGTMTDKTEGLDISKDIDARIVYVTRTGKKYHIGTCRYLRKSKIPMKLEDAQQSYQPCKVCKPGIN